MDWKYLDKETPQDQSGLYLTYSLNGSFSVAKYGHIYLTSSKDDMFRFYTSVTPGVGDKSEDLGFVFYTVRGKDTPLKGVILWCKIPHLPDDIKKENAQIRQYKEQIKKLKDKVRELERKEER